MATLEKQGKLPAGNNDSQEEHPRKIMSTDLNTDGKNAEYTTQDFEEVRIKVIKKISHESNRLKSRTLWCIVKFR